MKGTFPRVTHPSAAKTEVFARLACVKPAASVRSEPGSNSQVERSEDLLDVRPQAHTHTALLKLHEPIMSPCASDPKDRKPTKTMKLTPASSDRTLEKASVLTGDMPEVSSVETDPDTPHISSSVPNCQRASETQNEPTARRRPARLQPLICPRPRRRTPQGHHLAAGEGLSTDPYPDSQDQNALFRHFFG